MDTMVKYGYIIDISKHTHSGYDVVWPVNRFEKNDSIKQYNLIETSRDLSNDENVIIYKDVKSFTEWRYKYEPQDE